MALRAHQYAFAATAVAALATAMLLGVPESSFAQASEEFPVDVAECLQLESDLERFGCYERRVEAAQAAQERATASARQVEEAESDATIDAAVEAREEFVGTIASLREREPNAYVITLENGQVWYQTRPERYVMRPGQQVRLYPTRWARRTGSRSRRTADSFRSTESADPPAGKRAAGQRDSDSSSAGNLNSDGSGGVTAASTGRSICGIHSYGAR